MDSATTEDITILLQQVKLGSEPAFNALYKLHSATVLGNIRKLVKDNEIAKELLQDLYLKVWENRAIIDPEKSFKAFLFTIAKNMVFDYFRRVSLDKRAKVNLLANAIESYSPTDEYMEFKESSALLKSVIDQLPQQCRQVYVLSKLEGKSHHEICQQLGIAVSTVNNHMVRANREVRSFLLKNAELTAIIFTTVIFDHFGKY